MFLLIWLTTSAATESRKARRCLCRSGRSSWMPVACLTCMPAGNYGRSLQHRRRRLSLQSMLFSKKPSTSDGEHQRKSQKNVNPLR